MLRLFDFEVRKYKRLRAVGVPLMTEVGKAIPTDLILQAARDLRMLGKDGKTVKMDSEDEISFVMDRAILDIPWPKERWIEQVRKPEISDYEPGEQAMLKAYCEAFFSLYEVTSVEAGRGLRLRDLFGDRELLLIDIGLARTARQGGLLAARVITVDGISFTSGVGMPFPPSDKRKLVENFTALFEKKKGTMTWEQMMRHYAPYFFIEFKRGSQGIEFAEI